MSQLIKENPVFIGVNDLSNRWGISPSAIYSFKAGTEDLRRYRFGKSIKFEMVEIIKFENNKIKQNIFRGKNK